jgi:hypothetical protein
VNDPADYVYSDPYASDYERGLWDPATHDPAGPHDEGTRGPFDIPIETNEALPDNVIMVVPRRGPLDHCGHVLSACGCDNSPDPEQAYHAVREILEVRDDELATARAEVARLSALLDEERRKVQRLESEWDAMRQNWFDVQDDWERALPVVEAAEAAVDGLRNTLGYVPPGSKWLHDFTHTLVAAVDSYRSRSADPAGEQGSGT